MLFLLDSKFYWDFPLSDAFRARDNYRGKTQKIEVKEAGTYYVFVNLAIRGRNPPNNNVITNL